MSEFTESLKKVWRGRPVDWFNPLAKGAPPGHEFYGNQHTGGLGGGGDGPASSTAKPSASKDAEGFPTFVMYNGQRYEQTGKVGTRKRDGAKTKEVRYSDEKVDVRGWVDSKGNFERD